MHLNLSSEPISLEEAMGRQNIADFLMPEDLSALGAECKRLFELDDKSRSDWLDKHDKAMDLALQIAKEKEYPFEKASNIVFPLLTTAAMQFAARAYPAIIPGEQLVRCKVIGDDSGMYDIPEGMQPQVGPDGNPAVMTPQGLVPVPPTIPPGHKANAANRVGQHLSWQYLHQMPEWEPDTDQMLHYLPIAGCAFRKYMYDDTEKRPRTKWVMARDFVVDNSASSLDECNRYSECLTFYPHEMRERMLDGRWLEIDLKEFGEPEGEDKSAPVDFVEMHVRLDLDQDDYPEPYIVTFSKEAAKVVRVQPGFTQNQVKRRQDGALVAVETRCMYVKYSFIPNPDRGFYDVGLGWLLGPVNEAVNTCINQMFDAGHWQNTMQGFVGKGLKVRGGTMTLRPNEFKMVDAPGDDIRKHIYQIQHPGPSPVLFQLLGLLIEAGRDISSVKDIMMGESQSNLAPGTIANLIEQGTKQFQSIFKRLHRAFTAEAKLLFELNRETLPEQMVGYGEVLEQPDAIARTDYEQNYDIAPVTDPSLVSDQQKMMQAQLLVGLSDAGKVSPQEATKRMLEAIRVPDVDKLLDFQLPPNPEVEFRNKELQLKLMELASEMAERDDKQVEAIAKAVKTLAEAAEKGGDISELLRVVAAIDASEEPPAAQNTQDTAQEIKAPGTA